VRTFDNNKGYKIIDLAYRHHAKGLGFRELQRVTGYHSRNTLDMWVNRLRNLGFFMSSPRIPIRLTEEAIFQYENGSLVLPSDYRSARAIIKTKRINPDENKERNSERRQNVYLLILSIAAFGATYYRSTSKLNPGQFVVRNIYKNKKISYSSFERPGVGLVDLVDKRRTRLDYLPPRRKNIGNDELFGYIGLTKSEAEQYIKELQCYDPPTLHVIDHKPNDKTRYGIPDPLLIDFVAFCIITLGDVEWKMQYVWLYQRPGLRKFVEDDEKKWYTRLYGNEQKGRRLTSYFWRLVRMKKDFRKLDRRRQNELTEHADNVIAQLDKSIRLRYQIIMSQKYKSVRERYNVVTGPLIEAVFPSFLRTAYQLGR
jgi:hypothetical protein